MHSLLMVQENASSPHHGQFGTWPGFLPPSRAEWRYIKHRIKYNWWWDIGWRQHKVRKNYLSGVVSEGLTEGRTFELRPKLWGAVGHIKMGKNVLGQRSEVAHTWQIQGTERCSLWLEQENLGGGGVDGQLRRQEPNHAGLMGQGKKATFTYIAMGSSWRALGSRMI